MIGLSALIRYYIFLSKAEVLIQNEKERFCDLRETSKGIDSFLRWIQWQDKQGIDFIIVFLLSQFFSFLEIKKCQGVMKYIKEKLSQNKHIVQANYV